MSGGHIRGGRCPGPVLNPCLGVEGDTGEGAGTALRTARAPRTVLGYSPRGRGALSGRARLVPCPQAAAPLLLWPEDMSSPLKDISTRRRGCGGRGNAQQEGTGTGRERPEEKLIYAGM